MIINENISVFLIDWHAMIYFEEVNINLKLMKGC